MFDEDLGSIIPQYILDTLDSGKYFIRKSTLINLTIQELDIASAILQALADSNPDFEFSIQEDVFDRDIIVRWVRKVHEPRTEAQSNN